MERRGGTDGGQRSVTQVVALDWPEISCGASDPLKARLFPKWEYVRLCASLLSVAAIKPIMMMCLYRAERTRRGRRMASRMFTAHQPIKRDCR